MGSGEGLVGGVRGGVGRGNVSGWVRGGVGRGNGYRMEAGTRKSIGGRGQHS